MASNSGRTLASRLESICLSPSSESNILRAQSIVNVGSRRTYFALPFSPNIVLKIVALGSRGPHDLYAGIMPPQMVLRSLKWYPRLATSQRRSATLESLTSNHVANHGCACFFSWNELLRGVYCEYLSDLLYPVARCFPSTKVARSTHGKRVKFV